MLVKINFMFFTFHNVVTTTFKFIFVANIVFLLDSTELAPFGSLIFALIHGEYPGDQKPVTILSFSSSGLSF